MKMRAKTEIRIVIEGHRGENSIAKICRVEGIAQSLYYSWSKEFFETDKKRLAEDTKRSATTNEVKDLHRESTVLKELVAEQALEIRILKNRILLENYHLPGDLEQQIGKLIDYYKREIRTKSGHGEQCVQITPSPYPTS